MAITRSTGFVNKLNGIKTNLLLNGAFDSDATEWAGFGASLASTTGGQDGNGLTVTLSDNAPGAAYQDIPTKVGQVYKLAVWFKKGSSAGGSIAIGATDDVDSIYNGPLLADTEWTKYRIAFIAEAAITRISLRNNGNTTGQTALFDSVNCDEVYDGFIEIMRNCKCNIYTSPRPANADAAATGTLLCTVTKERTATGLTFTESANGIVHKNPDELWEGVNVETGTAAWFRFFEEDDDPSLLSTTRSRFDGSVGTTGTDMIVGSTILTQSLVFEITGFNYTAPKG